MLDKKWVSWYHQVTIAQKGAKNVKATGIVRSIDSLGRIVITVELRRTLNVEEGDALEIFSEDNTIILRKYLPSCIFCGDSRNVSTFRGYNVCPSCVDELRRRY